MLLKDQINGGDYLPHFISFYSTFNYQNKPCFIKMKIYQKFETQNPFILFKRRCKCPFPFLYLTKEYSKSNLNSILSKWTFIQILMQVPQFCKKMLFIYIKRSSPPLSFILKQWILKTNQECALSNKLISKIWRKSINYAWKTHLSKLNWVYQIFPTFILNQWCDKTNHGCELWEWFYK